MKKEIREFFYGLKNVKVAIEASTNYSYIVDALVKEGYEILVADLTRGNLLPKSWIPPKEIRELRDLVRQRIFLLKQKTKIKNKIHGELIKRGIECRGNIFTKSGKEWLHSLKIPAIETYLSIMENCLKAYQEYQHFQH